MFRKLELLILLSSLLSILFLNLEQSTMSCLSSSTSKEGIQHKHNCQGKERKGGFHTLHFTLKAGFVPSNYGTHNNSKYSTQTEFWCYSVSIIIYSVCQSSASVLFSTTFNIGTGQTLLVLLVSCRQGKMGRGWVSSSIQKHVLIARL